MVGTEAPQFALIQIESLVEPVDYYQARDLTCCLNLMSVGYTVRVADTPSERRAVSTRRPRADGASALTVSVPFIGLDAFHRATGQPPGRADIS